MTAFEKWEQEQAQAAAAAAFDLEAHQNKIRCDQAALFEREGKARLALGDPTAIVDRVSPAMQLLKLCGMTDEVDRVRSEAIALATEAGIPESYFGELDEGIKRVDAALEAAAVLAAAPQEG